MSNQYRASQSVLPGLKNIQNNSDTNNQNNVTTQNEHSQTTLSSDMKSKSKKIFTYASISSSSHLKRSKDDNLDTYMPSTFFLGTSIFPSLHSNVPTSIVVLDWKSQYQLETKYQVKELQASQKHRRCLSLTVKSPSQLKRTILLDIDDAPINSHATHVNTLQADHSTQEESATEPVTEPEQESISRNASLTEYEVRNLRISYEETLNTIRNSQPDQFYENYFAMMTKSNSESNLSSHLTSDDSIQLGESISNQYIPTDNHAQQIQEYGGSHSSSSSSSKSSKSSKKKVTMLSKDQHSHSDSALVKSGLGKKKHGIFHVFSKLSRKNKTQGSLLQQLQDINTKIKQDPNNLHLYLERARIHVQMGNIELAKHDYDLIQHPSHDMVARTNNNN